MSNVLHMVHLDILTMKPYLKSYLIMFAIAVFIAITNESISFVTVMITIYLLMMSGTVFSVQEKNKLDRLYSALAVDGNTVVLGRYIFTLLHGVFAIAASYLIAAAMAVYNGGPVDTGEFLAGAVAAMVLMFFAAGMQLPLYYRFGYTKARFACVAPFVLVFIFIFAAEKIAPNSVYDILNRLQADMTLFAATGFALAVLLFIGSYYLSLRMRRRGLQI